MKRYQRTDYKALTNATEHPHYNVQKLGAPHYLRLHLLLLLLLFLLLLRLRLLRGLVLIAAAAANAIVVPIPTPLTIAARVVATPFSFAAPVVATSFSYAISFSFAGVVPIATFFSVAGVAEGCLQQSKCFLIVTLACLSHKSTCINGVSKQHTRNRLHQPIDGVTVQHNCVTHGTSFEGQQALVKYQI
jgi:hypothetical protein